ncbi:MAG: hypothetical protein ACLFSB_04975 [Chitinispirillaceae bacterium]
MIIQYSPASILLTGYALCFMFCNMIAFLISAFYRKKFNQAAPQAGFTVAIALTFLYIVSLFISSERQISIIVFQSLFVFGAAVASAWTSLGLYFTMRKVQK